MKFKSILLYLVFSMTLTSCSYFFVSKKSQLYYQKRDVTYNVDSSKVIKFNCYALKELLLKNQTKKYFFIGHCNNFCRPVNDQFQEYKSICLKSDSTYFIPMVHDYLYNISIIVGNKENYNDKNELFVTDIKSFRKGLNPNVNYDRQFLNYFYNNPSDTINSNFYLKYREQYVIFQNDYRPLTSKSIAEIIAKSQKISFSLD